MELWLSPGVFLSCAELWVQEMPDLCETAWQKHLRTPLHLQARAP